MNQLSDGEFVDVIDYFGYGRKTPKWHDLILWHRGKQPYATSEEKAEFDGYDLNSLRVVAVRRLDEAIAVLRTGLPAGLDEIAHRIETTPLEELRQALASILAAKAHATKRCYLERLLKLVTLESSILGVTCSGSEREVELKRLNEELKQAQANLVLAPQIAYYRTDYLQKVWVTGNKEAALDHKIIRAYLETDFAGIDVSGFPLSLMSEKLLLDEVFNALDGNLGKAIAIAEYVWEIDQQSPFLSPVSRAKLMVRLNDYYINLGDRARGEQLIAQFAAFYPEAPQNRTIYLIRYMVVLLDWATDGDGRVSLDSALEIFERNESFVLDSPIGGYRSRILIAMMVTYLGKHETGKAKRLFDQLYRDKDQKPPLLYRISSLICHLMILFDSHEIAELKHHAKNHREFMVEKGKIAEPAIHFLVFLQKNARRYASSKPTQMVANAYKSELEAMVTSLIQYQSQDIEVRRLFYGPFISWLNAKRI